MAEGDKMDLISAIRVLAGIGEKILAEDPLGTKDPSYCVQLRIRVPTVTGGGDGVCFYDNDAQSTCYDDDEDKSEFERMKKRFEADPSEGRVTRYEYLERWETSQVCLTKPGAEAVVAADGHNLAARAHGDKCIRLFVDSFYRNREMAELREALKVVAGSGLLARMLEPGNDPTSERTA